MTETMLHPGNQKRVSRAKLVKNNRAFQRLVQAETIFGQVAEAAPAKTNHITRTQEYAQDCGIDLPITGVLDAHTSRFCATFQGAFILGPYLHRPLKADGWPGTYTSAAIDFSRANGLRIANDFKLAEFLTNGSRTVTTENPVVLLERNLMILVQSIRDYTGIAFSPTSAYRDPAYNAQINGATRSQHMLGRAIDFSPELLRLTEQQVRALGAQGVGIMANTGHVLHVDVRGYAASWFYY